MSAAAVSLRIGPSSIEPSIVDQALSAIKDGKMDRLTDLIQKTSCSRLDKKTILQACIKEGGACIPIALEIIKGKIFDSVYNKTAAVKPDPFARFRIIDYTGHLRIDKSIEKDDRGIALMWAASYDRVEVFEKLIKDGDIDPYYGIMAAVEFFSKQHNKVDDWDDFFNRESWCSFFSEDSFSHFENLILKDGSFNGYFRTDAIWDVAAKGYADILEVFLNDGIGTCDESWHDRAVVTASVNGHLDIIKMLLEERPLTDATKYNVMSWAVGRGHVHILKFLSEKVGEFTVEERNYFFPRAGMKKDVLKILLKRGGISKENRDALIRQAASTANIGVFELLLTADDGFSKEERSLAIMTARRYNHPEVITWLLKGQCSLRHKMVVEALVEKPDLAFLKSVLASGPILDSVRDRLIEVAGSLPLQERIFLKDHKDYPAILEALESTGSLKRFHLIWTYYKRSPPWGPLFPKE